MTEERKDKKIGFFSSNGAFQSAWRVFMLILSAMLFIGAAWFHEFNANIAQKQASLIQAQTEQKFQNDINCEKIRDLEKAVADRVTRAELTETVSVLSKKLDFLREDMTAFNIKILEYLRDNNAKTRRE